MACPPRHIVVRCIYSYYMCTGGAYSMLRHPSSSAIFFLCMLLCVLHVFTIYQLGGCMTRKIKIVPLDFCNGFMLPQTRIGDKHTLVRFFFERNKDSELLLYTRIFFLFVGIYDEDKLVNDETGVFLRPMLFQFYVHCRCMVFFWCVRGVLCKVKILLEHKG